MLMSADPNDRRKIYDADYFVDGGVERRKGDWERRSGRDRRFLIERRLFNDPNYTGPERRSGVERRIKRDRRKSID